MRTNDLFDGVLTELLEFYPYERQGERYGETRRPEGIGLGVLYHNFTVSLTIETSAVSIWDGTDFDTPERWDEDEGPEPVLVVPGPLRFFDEYVFGRGTPS